MKTLSAHWKSSELGESNMESFHAELQRLRKLSPADGGRDISFKEALDEVWGMTPEQFYSQQGIDLKASTVNKLLETGDLNRFLLPEIVRDAIRRGLEYSPFYKRLITREERIEGTGITMPSMDWTTVAAREELKLRDTAETATITEAELIVWNQKQVTIGKKARGLLQSYESILFTPVDLAAIYFEELGAKLGMDFDRDLINIALNGDQADMSQATPVIGATVANTLAYIDLARAWVRFKRIGRNSTVMLCNEADALTILNMPQFENKNPAGGQSSSGVSLNVSTPLPTSQDILVHDAIPDKKIILIDVERAFVQLTAMPLLIETETIIRRQLKGEFVSMMTGFANIFKDGRLVLDYSTNLATNPGPTAIS